jgi:hypothetical protein
MASSDDPSHREGRSDRRELLGGGRRGRNVGVAARARPGVLRGRCRFKGRWLKGDLSLITWAHFVPASTLARQDVGAAVGRDRTTSR